MRNLKKLLALVLAMVMAFSLMLSAGAVDYDDYGDADQITEEFDEAVRVLTGLKVMQGDEKGFRPGDSITRAEAAAIIYRAATGDVKDDQTKLYADYGTFTDVKSDDWFAGYVGFCQNAGYIKGTTPTTFEPYGKVTGWEVLAMILRAVGYGKNNEFTGPTWQVNVASLAESLHITDNVKDANFASVLGNAARRDVVADLVFETMAFVPTVTYTPALNYSDTTSILGGVKNDTLGQKIFGLRYTDWLLYVGDWGEPGYYWFTDKTQPYEVASNLSNVVATILPEPTKIYVDTVRECDVSEDLGIKISADFELIVDQNWLTDADEGKDDYQIVATDTVTKVGGQGRESKFWYNVTRRFDGSRLGNTAVMIDTYLAKVTRVEDAVLDRNEHVVTPARMYVEMYDEAQRAATPTLARPHQVTISKPSTSKDNWTYAVGDYILVNAKTVPGGNSATPADVTAMGSKADNSPLNHTDNQANAEKAAFETNKTLSALIEGDTANVVGKSEPVIGKQTVTYWNAGKHTVEGTDYNDQLCLFLDKAGTTTNTTFAWYLDQRGNLIGISDQPTTTYGVITALWSSFGQGDTDTDGTAKTYAKVKYADGNEGTVVIDRFLMAGINTTGHKAAGTQVNTTNNSIALVPIYDYNTGAADVMKVGGTVTADARAALAYNLLVAPVSSVNLTAEAGGAAPRVDAQNDANSGYFGVIKDHLFKFVSSANETVVAVEVAGKASGPVSNDPYTYQYNAETDRALPEKLYKNLGYIATQDTGSAKYSVRMDNDTKIMVWNGTNSGSVSTYDGLSALPGDIDLLSHSEIDWADPDNDGIAEYVYVWGKTAGTVTHNLIYFNGAIHSARWNDPENKGTMTVVKDGKETLEVTFDDKDEFLTVQGSASYGAHLFAVEMTDGVITNLMGAAPAGSGNNKERLVAADLDSTVAAFRTPIILGTDVKLNAAVSAATGVTSLTTAFQTLPTYGNSYTARTKIVYVRDNLGDGDSAGKTRVSWDRGLNDTGINGTSIFVETTNGDSRYELTGVTQIVGDRLDDLNTNRIVDVSIVYEEVNGRNIATAVYLTTDPDVTPNPDPVGDTLILRSIAYSAANNGTLIFRVSAPTTDMANTVNTDKAVITLKNTSAGTTLINNQTFGDATITDTNNQRDGEFTITITGQGSMNNVGYQSFEGSIELTINGVTYTCNFSNRGIV